MTAAFAGIAGAGVRSGHGRRKWRRTAATTPRDAIPRLVPAASAAKLNNGKGCFVVGGLSVATDLAQNIKDKIQRTHVKVTITLKRRMATAHLARLAPILTMFA
jgi:hypothetical protein